MENNGLPGGGVLNSSLLSLEHQTKVSAFNSTYKNFSLKAGIIVEVHDIEDEGNISKLGIEYDVLVIEQDQDRSISAIRYKNCVSGDMFGSISDFFEFRYRGQSKKSEDDKDDGRNPEKQNGALVLILCLDGAGEKAIIMGALKHPQRVEVLDKEKGLHLHGEFNGLNVKVDKDGGFKIEFKGPRDDDGKLLDEDKGDEEKVGGSFLEIDKEGSIELATGNEESIKVDKKKKTIDIKAEKDISITSTKESVKVTAEKDMTMTVKGDWMASVEGKADITAKSGLNLKSDGSMTIAAANMKIMADGNFEAMATQFVFQGITFLGGAGGTPATTLSTQYIGTGNLGAPVVSLAIGPFSSQVFIAS